MNSHSLRACQLTRDMATFPGNIASMMLQYTAPLPNCQIFVTQRPRVAFTQFRRSLLGTKKAPSIIPMLCYYVLIKSKTILTLNLQSKIEINRLCFMPNQPVNKFRKQQIKKLLSNIQMFLALCQYYNILMHSNLYGKLYLQAQATFSKEVPEQLTPDICCYLYTPTLKQKLSLERYYALFNIYYLQRPKTIHAFINNQLPAAKIDLSNYLQALKSLSLVLTIHHPKYKHLKQIYRVISQIADVKKCLAEQCSIPDNIGQTIEGLGKKNRTIIDLQDKNQTSIPKFSTQCRCQELSMGYSKVTILTTNFKECSSEQQFDKIWTNISNTVGYYNLNFLKIFDVFITSLLPSDNIKPCIFILKKFNEAIGSDALLRHLMEKIDNKYFQQGQRLIYRGKLSDVLLQMSLNEYSTPNQQIFRTLSILIKAGIIQHSNFFSLLTPSLELFTRIEDERTKYQAYYVKKCFKKSLQVTEKEDNTLMVWGQLLFSSKLQLLNHLLLINHFEAFKEILTKYNIKLELIYCPNILQSLCSLLQWIIQPLYQIVDFTIYFKANKKRYRSFPEGYFKQYKQITNCLIDSLSQIIEMGKGYLFSKASTFIKTCRFLKQICRKNSKLSFLQSEMVKKAWVFAANIAKKYLLPAVQFYDKDPTITNELDRLIDSFKFKFQFQIYTDCLKQRQFSNLHLSVFHEEVTSQIVKCINRLRDSDLVINKINSLLICHPFSSFFQIFQRMAFISKEQLMKIAKAMDKTPRFTKKVALYFVFLQMCEHEDQMVNSDSEISKKYEYLIAFTQQILTYERKSEEFVKIVFEYFTYKLSNFNSDIKLLSNFDIFHGQIYLLEGLLQNLMPIELDQCCINDHDRKYLIGGPLLKVKMMNKIEEFNSTRVLRSNIVKCLFKSSIKCIFDNCFYYIILKLNTIQQFIVRHLTYNISVTAVLYDKFLKLMLNIINIAHFETGSNEIMKYFKYKLFQPLVTYYKMPYQISFYIIRKSITQQLKTSKYDWNQEDNWNELKRYFTQPIRTFFKTNPNQNKKSDSYSQQDINTFLAFDAFLVFWIQDIEYSLFISIYTDHINDLQQELYKKSSINSAQVNDLRQFCTGLIKQRDVFAQIHYALAYEQSQTGKQASEKYHKRYTILMDQEEGLQEKYIKFSGMFIRYCIMPRSMLNKSEAYYSWCFYFHFLKKNRLPIQLTIKLICQLLKSISQFVPFSTQRESIQLLPLLYNSSISILSSWYSLSKFSDKLEKHKLIKNQLRHQEYLDILQIIYDSQTTIIQFLLEEKSEVYSMKNCINFMYKCQLIPFCTDHGSIIVDGFNQIQNKYKQCKDVIAMISSYSKEFQKKLSESKCMNKIVKQRYDAKNRPQTSRESVSSLNMTCSDLYGDEAYDPLDQYPQLSASLDYADTFSEKQQRTPKRKNNITYSQIDHREIIEQIEDQSKKKKRHRTRPKNRSKSKKEKDYFDN